MQIEVGASLDCIECRQRDHITLLTDDRDGRTGIGDTQHARDDTAAHSCGATMRGPLRRREQRPWPARREERLAAFRASRDSIFFFFA